MLGPTFPVSLVPPLPFCEWLYRRWSILTHRGLEGPHRPCPSHPPIPSFDPPGRTDQGPHVHLTSGNSRESHRSWSTKIVDGVTSSTQG